LSKATAITQFKTVTVHNLTLDAAIRQTAATGYDNAEGFVLTWYRPNCVPYRLKLKYVEYLRLHRMVTGVSPKRIWEVLSQAHLKADLNEYLLASTPWFSKFVTKWVNAFQQEYDRLHGEAHTRYQVADLEIRNRHNQMFVNPTALRKEYAENFNTPENKEFAPIMFAMLDNKDVPVVLWKRCKELARNGHPMVDIHTT
jgi:RNA ligase